MKNLIEALTIFAKYQDLPYPTSCAHDVLYIMGITRDEMTEEDRAKVEALGFFWSEDQDVWQSFKYGSA